ncbi:RodZ domain-containing protein [Shewanella halifaxensis]|uniref:RodZ domain-containing protein n=1 Tax=Shewanella halifaxensis TaxID=271098 RepID=UPI000D5A1CDE|nr:RodZ domain-containing protein [Shewanella halifaxensis]
MKNEQNQAPNVNNESLVDEPTVTLGVLLKTARENKGLSIEALASQLHLRPAIIEQIEADKLQEVGASTYVRGYVKNYARAVQADPFAVKECLDKQLEDDEKPSMQSFSRKTTHQARDGRLMALTYIIVFVLLALMVLWWFQKSSMETAVDYSQPTAEEVAASAESGLPNPVAALLDADSSDATVVNGVEGANLDYASELTGEDPALAVAQDLTSNTIGPDTTDVASVQQGQTRTEAVNQAAPAEQNDVATTQISDTTDSNLTLTLTGDCWIKVTDASGKILVSDLKRSGNQINLTGPAPFAVTLGAPQVVNIQLNGADINLDAQKYPRGKVARLTLPLAEQ